MCDKITYYVNEKKRTVTAVLETADISVVQEAVNIMEKGEGNCIKKLIDFEFADYLLTKPKYTATARCHPDNEFDVEIGKKIARKKMFKTYLKDKRRITKKLSAYFRDVACRIDAMDNHVVISQIKIENALEEYKK